MSTPVFRRSPPPAKATPPAKPAHLVPPSKPDTSDPKELQKWADATNAWAIDLGRYVYLLGQFVTNNWEATPSQHATTHLPNSQIDPLPIGTPGPLVLDGEDTEGSSNNFNHGDHSHETPLTTKGDLMTVAGGVLARLGVGANDYVLTADSVQAEGIKWAPTAGDSAEAAARRWAWMTI